MARKRPSASSMWDDSLATSSTAHSTPVSKRQRAAESYTPDPIFNGEPEQLEDEIPDEESLWCRVCSDWMLYDTVSRKPISLDALLKMTEIRSVSVTGQAARFVDNFLSWDEWDDAVAPPKQIWVPVKLLVLEVDFDYCGKDPGWVCMKDFIWIKTRTAWYALGRPSVDYCKVMPDAGLPYRAAQLIVRQALDRPGWGRLDFETWMLYQWDDVLDRCWKYQDLRYHADDIRKVLSDILDSVGDDDLHASKLVQGILGPTPGNDDVPTPPADLKVGPIVNQYSRLWFRTRWDVLDGDDVGPPHNYAAHQPAAFKPEGNEWFSLDPSLAVFSEPFPQVPPGLDDIPCSSEPSGIRYNRLDCGTQRYVSHDFVRVGSEDEIWIARIAYFFVDGNGDKCFHAEWLERASKVLGKVADPTEMLIVALCDNVSLGSIIGPPIYLQSSPGNSQLFCRHIFSGSAFTTLQRMDKAHRQLGRCFVKAAKLSLHDNTTTQHSARDQIVHSRGVLYHRYDFVFLRPRETDVSTIAQIRMVKGDGKVQVSPLERGCPDDKLRERCLVLTGDPLFVSASHIVGRCRVVVGKPTDEALIEDPWLFYVEQAIPESCAICRKSELRHTMLTEAFMKDKNGKQLQMIDPFCGAGGLANGIERGSRGHIATKYAVDIDEPAVQAFSKNHPHAKAFHADCNSFFASLVQETGIRDITGVTVFPANDKGRVEVICAGAPCQGHSTLNSHRTADDPKNCLVLTALSLVEHLRPRYFVLENVVMILGWRLMAQQRGQGIIRGGEEHGGVYLITAILLRLGYQVRIGLLNAGMHGTPQNRRRFFLIAADSESTLPEFPHPTHAFPAAKTLKMAAFPSAQPGWPVDAGVEAVGDDQMRLPPICVPHPRITVEDAIGDLAGFNWKSGQQRPPSLPSFKCHPKKGCIPDIADAYTRAPRNEYQVRLRLKVGPQTADQLQHVTAGFKQYIVENVWDIPVPHAEEEDDDPPLGWTSINPSRRRAQYGISDPTSHMGRGGLSEGRYYRRLKLLAYFATLVTNVRPTAKQSQVLHPFQFRLVTVREQARAQGFTDDFKFVGTPMEMQRQIGNAVPVTLAEAIGRELFKSMFNDWCASPAGQRRIAAIDRELHI